LLSGPSRPPGLLHRVGGPVGRFVATFSPAFLDGGSVTFDLESSPFDLGSELLGAGCRPLFTHRGALRLLTKVPPPTHPTKGEQLSLFGAWPFTPPCVLSALARGRGVPKIETRNSKIEAANSKRGRRNSKSVRRSGRTSKSKTFPSWMGFGTSILSDLVGIPDQESGCDKTHFEVGCAKIPFWENEESAYFQADFLVNISVLSGSKGKWRVASGEWRVPTESGPIAGLRESPSDSRRRRRQNAWRAGGLLSSTAEGGGRHAILAHRGSF
jgi:hypothetical protein